MLDITPILPFFSSECALKAKAQVTLRNGGRHFQFGWAVGLPRLLEAPDLTGFLVEHYHHPRLEGETKEERN